MILPRLPFTLLSLFAAVHLYAQQNNTLQGRVLYQSSGNKPAVGVQIKEQDSNGAYSSDKGEYRLVFQTKRNGAALSLDISPDTRDGKKIELVNDKEVKTAKLPANAEEVLDIIVCPAGQRDIAAQKYYRILRTTADRELEKKKKEVEGLLAQKEKDYQKISDLFAQLDGMQAALDSVKIREQAFNIASINLDRASEMVKAAVRKIEEDNDVEGALKILNAESLDTAYEHASALKKKAEVAIRQVIEGYEFKISLLKPQFKYGEIAECYEKIAGIFEKEDYDKEKLATNFSNAAFYWGSNGDYQKGLELDLKALAIMEKALPADHLDLASLFNNFAWTYTQLGEYQRALEFNLKALAIREKVLSPDHADLARSYNNLATTHSHLSDPQKALIFNLKALDILGKVLPANHPDLGTLYNNLAELYTNLGKFQNALEYSLKALDILEKALPASHPTLAMMYNNMGTCYFNLGEFRKALEFHLKASAIYEKALPVDHPQLGTLYNNLAAAYLYTGEYQKALEFNLKAIGILEKTLPADHPHLGILYGNMAFIYGELGDYQKQLELYLKVLSFQKKILSVDHPDLATTYGNLGQVYGILKEYQKQLELTLESLAIREKILPADHPDLALSYSNLASAYGSLLEHQKALEFNLKALAIREKILPADHPSLAITYTNIGRTYRDVGDYEKGIEYGQKAIRIGEASNPKHSYLNRFYSNLTFTYLKAHRFPEAKSVLEKWESLKAETGVYRGWARYYALQKKKPQAIENLQKAVALGFKDFKWLETEPDLKNIRKEKGYKDLVEQLKKQ